MRTLVGLVVGLFIIGVLGGVASGKTLVTKQLSACGAAVLDGDRAGHEVLEEQDVRAAIRDRWGEAVFGPDGKVRRPAVASIVFANPVELDFLEKLTHGRIRARLASAAERLVAEGVPVAVLDAPVMLKAGWHTMCHMVIFVDAPREVRLARACQRGWTEDDFLRREAAQEPVEVKRKHAAVVIDNSGSPEATRRQVLEIWKTATGTA